MKLLWILLLISCTTSVPSTELGVSGEEDALASDAQLEEFTEELDSMSIMFWQYINTTGAIDSAWFDPCGDQVTFEDFKEGAIEASESIMDQFEIDYILADSSWDLFWGIDSVFLSWQINYESSIPGDSLDALCDWYWLILEGTFPNGAPGKKVEVQIR